MAKYVVEFSPPERTKREAYDVTDSVLNYRVVLAPFQKQTQVEFSNVKLKEIAIKFLTFVNPLEKPGQFILSPPTDGVYFNMYKFNLEPHSECELVITWKPSVYGNMRTLVQIIQVDNSRKYDFVILGNCNNPLYKKIEGATSTYSKSKNLSIVKREVDCDQKNITTADKTKYVCGMPEKITVTVGPAKLPEPICEEILQLPIRRHTYVREKENLSIPKINLLCRDTILTSPERCIKRPDKKCQDKCFNNHFKLKDVNKSLSPNNDDSFKITVNCSTQLDDFNITPLQSTENLPSTFSAKKQLNQLDGQLNFDTTDESLVSTSLNSSHSKFDDVFNVPITCTPVKNKSTNDYYDKLLECPEIVLNETFMTNGSDMIYSELNASLLGVEQLSASGRTDVHSAHNSAMITLSNTLQERPSFTIASSHYKCSPKTYKNKIEQCSTSLQTTLTRVSKQDQCDQYLNCLTSPELLYHNFAEDPFLKMSQYYEAEWLNRQESDMIRWINALLTPTDKLIDEEQSDDVEQAAMAWIEASKTCNENKPMQFATQKDLFAAQIYRQSPQQWKALRKATKNLFMSTSVAPVLSKLTLLIEKDLITVRDDRLIHLDLSEMPDL